MNTMNRFTSKQQEPYNFNSIFFHSPSRKAVRRLDFAMDSLTLWKWNRTMTTTVECQWEEHRMCSNERTSYEKKIADIISIHSLIHSLTLSTISIVILLIIISRETTYCSASHLVRHSHSDKMITFWSQTRDHFPFCTAFIPVPFLQEPPTTVTCFSTIHINYFFFLLLLRVVLLAHCCYWKVTQWWHDTRHDLCTVLSCFM